MVNAPQTSEATGDLQRSLRVEALALGFATVGFARADGYARQAAGLEQWLGEGRHGSMEWMEARKD